MSDNITTETPTIEQVPLWNLSAVAHHLGVTPQMVSGWHRGPKSTPPSGYKVGNADLWDAEGLEGWDAFNAARLARGGKVTPEAASESVDGEGAPVEGTELTAEEAAEIAEQTAASEHDEGGEGADVPSEQIESDAPADEPVRRNRRGRGAA